MKHQTLIRLIAYMADDDKANTPTSTYIVIYAPPPSADETINKFTEWAKDKYEEKQVRYLGSGASSVEGSSSSFRVNNRCRKKFVDDFKAFMNKLIGQGMDLDIYCTKIQSI